MGRTIRSTELLIPRLILKQFPQNPDESIRWSELWKRAKARGLRSEHTLDKYLKRLCKLGFVVQEGKLYKLSRATMLWDVPEDISTLKWGGRTIEDKKALVAILEFNFSLLLDAYLGMLSYLTESDEIENEREAKECVSMFFQELQFGGLLTMLAINVWRRRNRVPLRALLDDGGLQVKLKSSVEVGIFSKSPSKKP